VEVQAAIIGTPSGQVMPQPIHIGIGGWTYPPWRGRFFPVGLPQAQELAFAARALTAIEINGTFYRTQTPATFAKWARETPEGFVFALKAPRYVTARGELATAGESVTRFLHSGLAELGDRLGPINWQLPPNKAFDPDDMAAFLDLLPDSLDGLPLRHAIEVRHESFVSDAFAALLRPRGITAVQAGDSEYPAIEAATARFAYLRIMGTREDAPQGYAPADLDRWADAARTIARDREVFLFVISGHKAANPDAALGLLERLG
jgi:uncharacterized protein YecE (DUF72 family)